MVSRLFVFFWLVMIAFAPSGRTADDSATRTQEETALADQVLKIFEAKCNDCHGADLNKPKGKFGYILDLKKVAENPEYVVKGDAKHSELYQMITNDEMPGEDAKVPPLTNEEKRTVHDWIIAGAPAPSIKPATADTPAPVEESPVIATPPPFRKRLMIWLGRFHSMSTHFPIALLLIAIASEGIAWRFAQESWVLITRFLTVLGAASGLMTATLGWLSSWYSSYGSGSNGWILHWHRWLGTGTAVWALICAALICSSECEEGSPERTRFRGALGFGALLISVTGFLGGSLVFGIDHYKW